MMQEEFNMADFTIPVNVKQESYDPEDDGIGPQGPSLSYNLLQTATSEDNESINKIDHVIEHDQKKQVTIKSEDTEDEVGHREDMVEVAHIMLFENSVKQEDISDGDVNINISDGDVNINTDDLKYVVDLESSKSVEKTTENVGLYQCKFCQFKTKHIRQLMRHFRVKHDSYAEWFRCQQCTYKSKDKYCLNRHVNLQHKKPESFHCEEFNMADFTIPVNIKQESYDPENDRSGLQGPSLSYNSLQSVTSEDNESINKLDYINEHDQKKQVTIKSEDTKDEVGHREDMLEIAHIMLFENSVKPKDISDGDVNINTDDLEDVVDLESSKSAEKTIENVGLYQCKFCQFKTKHIRQLMRHFRVIHDSYAEWFQCQQCTYKSKDKYCLNRHVNLQHKKLESFHCEQCPYVTKYKRHLERHVSTQHSKIIEWFQCRCCPFKTKDKYNLKKHFTVKHDKDAESHFCHVCDFETKYKQNLTEHIKYVHNGTVSWYYCQICSYKSRNNADLTKHVLRHDQSTNKTIDWLKCRFCGYKTKDAAHLNRHIKSKHNESIEWQRCKFCEYKTISGLNLSEHVDSCHNNEDIVFYNCNHCNFKTENRSEIYKHINSSHISENIEWQQCNSYYYKTKDKCQLRKHVTDDHN